VQGLGGKEKEGEKRVRKRVKLRGEVTGLP